MKTVFILKCFNCVTGLLVDCDYVFKSEQSAIEYQRVWLDSLYQDCESNNQSWRVSDYVFTIAKRNLVD